jgi:hypothetical protein
LDRPDQVIGVGFVNAPEVAPRHCVRPEALEFALGLGHEIAPVDEPQGSGAQSPCVGDGRDCLPRAGGVVQQRNRLTLVPHLLKRRQCIVLMGPQLQHFPFLARQEIVERKESRQSIQEEPEFLLDALRFVGHLAVGPAEDAPSLVNQAILPQ